MLLYATNDAHGSSYEFDPAHPDAAPPLFGVSVFGPVVGDWTEDTTMAMPILRMLAGGRMLEDETSPNESP